MRLATALLLAGVLLLGACSAGPTATPQPARLRIQGSTSMAGALTELATSFEADHPNVLVEVEGGGSAMGWEQLRRGAADVAALSWLSDQVVTTEGFRVAAVASDGIAIIVHPSNPITDITTLQLRSLFAGEILDWGALSAVQGQPAIVSREEGSGTRAAFESGIMGDRRVTLNALVMPTSQSVLDYVATHQLAVGYVTFDHLMPSVRAVPVEGIPPAREHVASGAYSLLRTLYLAVQEGAQPPADDFVVYALSAKGQRILSQHHTPLN